MAQSATTVTPPSPSPPTNMSFTGATGPNPPNYTKNTMNDATNWSATNPKTFPPPFFDDGAAGSLVAFAANTAALASGSGGTAGGTEGTYPGAAAGAVPASSSVAHEGAGTETVVTATVPNPSPNGQLQTVSCLGSFTANPNQDHASSLSPPGLPNLTSLGTNNTASGGGTVSQTITGTNFSPSSKIYVNGVLQTTTYTSRTSITAPTVTKKATAGTWPVQVKDASGYVESNTLTWTFT